MTEDADLSGALEWRTFPAVEPNSRLERLAMGLCAVQDSVIGTLAPSDIVDSVIRQLADITAQLEPYSLAAQPANGWDDTRRVAHTRTFARVLDDVHVSADHLSARVTFSAFYLGANGAAHGGSIPMAFDQALSLLAQFSGIVSRTAYLNVSYRAVTPISKPLKLEGRLERVDGRKRFVAGAILDGDVVTAEAHALYVDLRPDQD